MDKKKIAEFKNKLMGVELKMVTSTGHEVVGHLANSTFETKILGKSADDYFCLINLRTGRASFLLASDVEVIDALF